MEFLIEIGKIEELLNSPSVDGFLQLTNDPTQFTQESFAQNNLFSYAYHRYEQLLTDQN